MPGAVVSAFERWYLREAPPERLAVIRILVGAFATVYAAVRVPDLWKYAAFSDGRFRPVGISGLLDGPLSPAVWHTLLLVTVPLCVTFTLGWHHKVVAPIAAIVLLAVTTYHDSFGQLFHTENLMVVYVIVLAVVPAADAFSLDRRRAAARDIDAPASGPQYGWPAVLLSVLCVITYMLAGWAKISNGGWGWVHGDVLRNQIAFDNVRKAVMGDPYSAIGSFLVRHGWVFGPIADRGPRRRARRAHRSPRREVAQRLGDRRMALPRRHRDGHVHHVPLPAHPRGLCSLLRGRIHPAMGEPYDRRVARPSISPRAYRRLTLGALLLLAAIVVSGAAVRLTGSGLGCPDWPNCENGRLVAPLERHTLVEFTNRTITGLVSVAVILAVLGSMWRVPRRRGLIWLSWGLVAGVLAQIVLGGVTVLVDLSPPFVMAHFLLSMALLADAVVLHDRACQRGGPRRASSCRMSPQRCGCSSAPRCSCSSPAPS